MSSSPSIANGLPSTANSRQFRYVFWLVPGFIFSVTAYYIYPPIIGDSHFRPFWFMGIFVAAAALPRLWNLVRSRPVDDTAFPAAYAVSSVAYALIGLIFLLNGVLDRVPPTEIRCTVVEKILQVKNTQYHVIVSSWRPGENQEDFTVDPDVYHRAVVGRAVTVELHKGFFNIPWSSKISPE